MLKLWLIKNLWKLNIGVGIMIIAMAIIWMVMGNG